MTSSPIQFQLDSPFPLLESALLNLLKREERTWGYFQVKQENQDYVLCIPGLPKLKLSKSKKSYAYRAYWLNKKEPSIAVQRKERMLPSPKAKKENKQKTYEVLQYFDERENPQQQKINEILADLIKGEIENNLPSLEIGEMKPIVTIIKRERSL